MFASLNTLSRKLFALKNEACGRRARTEKRLHVEGLESRQLLTAGITANGVLQITQTNGDDYCFVRETATQYTVTEGLGSAAKTSYFNKSQVKGGVVSWYGFNGNDYFQNYTSLVTWAVAGEGNDYIWGGKAGDLIWGEGGNDLIFGGVFGTTTQSGIDWINGGTGNDIIYGHDGDDVIHGMAGDDRIYGGAGGDWIYGEEGNDYLYGEDGNDFLMGGFGADYLVGSYGDDYLDVGDANKQGNGNSAHGGDGKDTYKRYTWQTVYGFQNNWDRWA
jgi:Ca2+-binding RTX toxin-like protein